MSARPASVSSGLFLALVLASGAASAALTLNVELNPNPVRPNEVLLAQLTVANNGGSAVTAVTLQATVPSNVDSFSPNYITGGATCSIVINNLLCDSTEIVNWNLGTIPAGGGVTLSLPLTVSNGTSAGTTITLATTLLVNNVSTATANPSSVVSTTNALSLSVDEDKNPVAAGDTLIYTLTYANRAASSSVTGTTLSFPVPAGTTFVSATGGGSFSAGSVQWTTLGTLSATQSDHQQVVVSVNGGTANGAVLAAAPATISGSSGVAESASATAVTRVAATPPLVLGVEFNPDPVRPNEPVLAQVTVSNRGGVPLTGVVLQARVPQAIDSFNANYLTGGGACIIAFNNLLCDSRELANWDVGTIPAGGGITFSMSMNVTSGTVAGRLLSLEVLANDDGSNRAVNGTTVAVDSDNPLSLAVDEDRNPVAAGGTLTYTLTYGNRAATSSITSTALNFRVPAGTTFVSATGGGTLSADNVQWTSLGSLAATQSGHQQVVVTVNGGAVSGSLLAANAATIVGTNSSLVSESARATAIARVAATPPLVLGVEFNPDPVRPNEPVLAQVTVSNRGGVPLTGVVLQARVPQAIDSFNANYLTGGGACIIAFNNLLCDSRELANWDVGTIPAGGGITFSMSMNVTSGTVAGRLLSLEVLANDDGSNRAVNGTTVAVDSDNPLSLSVQSDRNPVAPNNALTYTLAYANRASTSSITSTALNFPIPAGTTFVSATGGGTLSAGNVQWTSLGSLAATQGDHQQVVVSVNAGTSNGSVLAVNAATIVGNNSSLVAEGARATAITRVAAAPPLVLGVEFNPDPVRPNEQVLAELTVSNRGGVPLTGVVLQARVPQAINSFNANYLTGGGACIIAFNNALCDSRELANWDVGTIPAGGGITFSMPMIVTSGTVAGRLLSLEVLANDDGSNRAVSGTTAAVDADNPLSLAVNDNLDAVPGGGVLQYTLTYGNRATSGSETAAVLTFPLPVETVLLGSTGGTVSGGAIVWNLGNLAAATGGRKIVTLSVPGAVNAGSVMRVNAAQLRGNVVAGVVPDAVRTMAATRVEAAKPIGLTLAMAPDPVQATQTLTGTLTVTNNSGGTLTGVTLLARVPQSVNSFNPSMLSGGGTCVIAFNNGLCDPGELATWSLGTMANGASTTVTMPMVVTAGTVNGRLISMESLVTDDGGKLSTRENTVLLNAFTDTDSDGVAQIYDNCTQVANGPLQPDAGGHSQLDADYDGYGNICDADLNNDGHVTAAGDYIRMRSVLQQPSTFSALAAAADMNGDGFVTAAGDYIRLRPRIATDLVGPSGLAP